MIVDTNVLLDLLDRDSPGNAAARTAYAALSGRHDFFVNEIVFAEVSGRYPDAHAVEVELEDAGLEIARLTLADCHRAGVAFREYRRAGGPRKSILPDFLIGAHAEGKGWPILTNDRKGFAAYFPKVQLIAPESADHG